MARSALLALRGQRDQILNTVGMVREIGLDLVKSDKIVKDINRRKFLSIVVLYLVAFLLFVSICCVVYFKLHIR